MYISILTYNTRGLPWVRDQSSDICAWLLRIQTEIICLQEVFVPATRAYYKEQLERAGYRVCIPRDEGVALVNSGLLTAFSTSVYSVGAECFYPYLDYHNIEIFTNKGFYAITVYHKTSGRCINIVNTHMQSDTEITWFTGRQGTHAVRKAQHQQIVDTLSAKGSVGGARSPVFLVGDLNIEHSPHSSVRYMALVEESRLQKATFYSTGENLDHCAWFPLQWAQGPSDPTGEEHKACAFCDFNRRGPRLTQCHIHQVPWSDHAPVQFSLFIPKLSDVHAVSGHDL